MAQVVGYFQNNVIFEEGPFVLCFNPGGFRIEVELRGHICPVLPDLSIYKLLKAETECPIGNTRRELKEPWADWLNRQVKAGRIVMQENRWICPEYSTAC